MICVTSKSSAEILGIITEAEGDTVILHSISCYSQCSRHVARRYHVQSGYESENFSLSCTYLFPLSMPQVTRSRN